MKELSKELHKPIKKKYEHRKIISLRTDQIWALDLIQLDSLADMNDGFKYILVIIDTYSRFVWAFPLKDKTAAGVVKALETLDSKPEKIHCDAGKEFVNKIMRRFMDTHHITMYHTYSESKSAIVERFNRTLKQWMWQSFTELQTRRWLEILPGLIERYNNRKHSTLGMTPTAARESEEKIPYESTYEKPQKPKFEVGDRVRISKVKSLFEKGYEPNWSVEIFTISEVKLTKPVTYHLKDYNNEIIKGTFYTEELQKTKQGDAYLVEKVLQRKKGKALVKWWGFDAKHNSWVDESEIRKI